LSAATAFGASIHSLTDIYGAPFVKILYLTDLAQILLSLRIFSYLCAEIAIGAERQWAALGEDSWNVQTWRDPLWNFKQKTALTLRPPPQVYRSPSSAQTNVIIKPV